VAEILINLNPRLKNPQLVAVQFSPATQLILTPNLIRLVEKTPSKIFPLLRNS
jgi:hypothetical protein